jgi:tubulin alpha
MREILQVCVGGAGVRIGSACWELFCIEHGIQPDGTRIKDTNTKDQVLFEERKNGQYIPRCMLLDTEPDIIENIAFKGP